MENDFEEATFKYCLFIKHDRNNYEQKAMSSKKIS